MNARLAVYTNSDDALLQWTVDSLDPNTVGFAVERRLSRDGRPRETDWLANFSPPGRGSHQIARYQPSEVWPFRCFSWTDHTVDPGDTVSYRVVPVLTDPPAVRYAMASRWSTPATIGDSGRSRYTASFNRGFVISQFMSRYLDEQYPGLEREEALKQFKSDIGTKVEDRIRAFLSGQLRDALLRLLKEVRDGTDHVYAALFELGDEQLIAALEALGPRVHLVLANGSIESKKGVPAAQARTHDENKDARARLLAAGADVDTDHRFVSPGPLAHNKFLVVTTAAGRAVRVWTGSTNWTTTGLCTQLNNGLLVDDPDVADLYLRQWRDLRQAGSTHPRGLAESNSRPGTVRARRNVRTSVQFTRAKDRADLAELGNVVGEADEGVLFLMFIPGASGVLADVRKLAAAKPGLLVRGVVSDLPKGRQDETTGRTTTVRMTLVGAPDALAAAKTFDVVQPRGMPFPAAGWAEETTRRQFRNAIGFAIIHSKVLVVDPFSADPVVVTGSHNFSISASSKNDENFIVVRGDRALAQAYAVNIESAWRHYAGRVGNPYPRLRGIDYLRALWDDQRRNEPFWKLAP
jgi:phosphatidylserine/phosphatidylglycerophosphate/cardiolipin synthase-like enzyme